MSWVKVVMTMVHFVKVVKSQARELKVSSSARVIAAPHGRRVRYTSDYSSRPRIFP